MLQRAQDEVTLLASLEKTQKASVAYLGKSGTSAWQLFDGHEMNKGNDLVQVAAL